MSRIFLSHSSRDEAATVALRDWLVTEGWDDLFLDFDPKRGISAGEKWEQALFQAMHRCEAVVLIVSRNWLASPWCRRELGIALRLNKRLFGVLIEPFTPEELPPELTSVWQLVRLDREAGLRDFRARLASGEEQLIRFPESGLTQLRIGLRKAGLDPLYFDWPPEGDPDRAPWPGMQALEAGDAGIFFGREAPLIAIMDQLRGIADGPSPRFLAVLGASGAGKSSFLRAGLLPRLARDDRHFLPLPVMRPGQAVLSDAAGGLIAVLSDAFCDAGMFPSRAQASEAVGAAVIGGAAALQPLLLRLAEGRCDPGQVAPALVLALDQGEELFAAAGQQEAAAFLDLLAGLLQLESPRIIFITTIRSDSYERLQMAAPLEGLRQQTFPLPGLPRGEWARVIEGPAERARAAGRVLKTDPALTSVLLADLEGGGGRDALPLLAFTLGRLWLRRSDPEALTLADYQATGGISGAMQAAADQALARAGDDPSLPADPAERLSLLRAAFIPWLAGIDPDTGTPRAQRARRAQIPPEARPLIAHFVSERLLSEEAEGGTSVIQPVHEALLRQWPTLNVWLKEDAVLLSVLEALLRASREWQRRGEDPAWASHRAGRLEDAEALAARSDLWARLEVTDLAYLAACRRIENQAREERERQLREIAAAHEKRAHAESLRRRNAMIGAVIAGVLAVIATGIGFYAFHQADAARQAEGAARSNESVALASLSEGELANGRPEAALQLALASWPRVGDPDRPQLKRSIVALGEALARHRQTAVLTGHDRVVDALAVLPDGAGLMSIGANNSLRRWSLPGGDMIGQEVLPEGSGVYQALSASGRWFSRADGGTLTLYELPLPGGAPRLAWSDPLKGHPWAVRFSDDDQYLGILDNRSEDGSLMIRSLTDGTEQIFAMQGAMNFALSHDAAMFASTSGDSIIVRHRATGAVRAELSGARGVINDLAFSPGGTWLAAASGTGEILLWTLPEAPSGFLERLAGPAVMPLILRGHAAGVRKLRFSGKGSMLASASDDGEILIWHPWSGGILQRLSGHTGGINDIVFAEDSGLLASAGNDRTVRLWSLLGPAGLESSGTGQGRLDGHAPSPDGRQIAVIPMAQGILLFDSETLATEPGRLLAESAAFMPRLAWRDDSAVFATATADDVLHLWDSGNGAVLHSFAQHQGRVRALTFQPGGDLLAYSADDDTIRLVNSRTGEVFAPKELGSWTDALAFTRDGSGLISGSGDGRLRLWQPATTLTPVILAEDAGEIVQLATDPDGTRVVTAGTDRILRLRDAKTGALLLQMSGHSETVSLLAFSADGRRLASASHDGTARLWDLQTGATLMVMSLGGPVFNSALYMQFHGEGGQERLRILTGSGIDWFWDTGRFSGLDAFGFACQSLGPQASLEALTDRLGLGGLVPVCGEHPPLPLDAGLIR